MSEKHIPVLLNEVLEALNPQDGETYIDGTFGAGGYSRAILEAAQCNLIAFDRDVSAFENMSDWPDDLKARTTMHHSDFGAMEEYLNGEKVDAVILDIGVSSMQIDQQERGFSYRFDGPLDMRMDRSQSLDAAQIVNTYEADALADIFYYYGEERHSRRLARTIVEHECNIQTTGALAALIEKNTFGTPMQKKDTVVRIFQALRIAVNDELGQLKQALLTAERILKPFGRLIVVTFHSLEDRIVKTYTQFCAGQKQQGGQSRYLPEMPSETFHASFTLPHKKPLIPGASELAVNPRARSSKLRYAIRTENPPVANDEVWV